MIASKILSFKSRIKQRIDNYINYNSDEIGFGLIFKFLVNHFCIAPASYEDYMIDNISKKRVIIVWAYYILMWFINIRFLLLAIINKPWIWTLFADPIYILRKPNLISLGIAICGLLAVFTQTLFVVFEKYPEFKPIIQMYSSNRKQYGLENRFYFKFCLKSNFMAKYFLGPFFRLAVFSITIIYVGLIVKAYIDSDFKFPIITSILSSILLFIWLDHCFAVVWVGVVVFYIITLHLKYNFRQIKNEMKQILRSGKSIPVINEIHKHTHYSELTLKFNKVFKYVLAMVYMLITPLHNIAVYMSLSETNTLFRLLYLIGLTILSTILFTVNYMSSSLSSSAHDFTSDLYTFLVSKRIPVQHKLKISSFIEKLCGPVIGYYCYELFPFTNYEFYQYVSFVFTNYILLNGLIFEV
jgi:hypothetical protein